MLYWFFVKGFGWIARRRMGPTAIGLENVPREGGAIIAANHLAVIDGALIPITCPRMVHFMGKAEYFEGKGIKGRFKKWWFTSVGVFPVDRSGGSKSLGALAHAREILEEGHLFGIHVEARAVLTGDCTGATPVPRALLWRPAAHWCRPHWWERARYSIPVRSSRRRARRR